MNAKIRCKSYRKRILEISQQVSALHINPAFSCLEIVDAIYHDLMDPDDTFVMSKGHGYMAQLVVLESFGIISKDDLDSYCTPQGRFGAHPDYGNPGIEASTGSLGHGLGIAVGMGQADKIKGDWKRRLYVVISDGEIQEGSTWEAIQMAANLDLSNLTVFMDYNNFQSLERQTESHPWLHPFEPKLRSFGWASMEVNGHDSAEIVAAAKALRGDRPVFIICRTIKGKGVSWMENVPIWHYRSPSPEEYLDALAQIEAAS